MATKPYTLPNGKTIYIPADKKTYPIEQVQKQSREWQRKYYDYLYNDRGAGWFWAGLDHLNPQNDVNYVSKEQQEKIKSGNTNMTYNGGDLQEIVVTPNGVREPNTPTNIAVETDWTPEDYESTKGAMVHYDPIEDWKMTNAWKNGGYYNGKYIPKSNYANLGNEAALAIGVPMALTFGAGPLAEMLASSPAAGNFVADQVGKESIKQGGKWFVRKAAQEAGTNAMNYFQFAGNAAGGAAALSLPTTIQTLLPYAATASAAPLIYHAVSNTDWSSLLKNGILGQLIRNKFNKKNEQKTDKKDDQDTSKHDDNGKKNLRDRWNKLPFWQQAALGYGGYKGINWLYNSYMKKPDEVNGNAYNWTDQFSTENDTTPYDVRKDSIVVPYKADSAYKTDIYWNNNQEMW